MEITAVPFAAHNGIAIKADGTVFLPFVSHVKNQFSGVHAAAQFLLAESASGYYLLTAFPELVGKITPLLRESHLKYIQQAQGELYTRVRINGAEKNRFLQTLLSRQRALIKISVDVLNSNDETTCSAEFKWFVQMQEGVES